MNLKKLNELNEIIMMQDLGIERIKNTNSSLNEQISD